jgi:hypothetical protein
MALLKKTDDKDNDTSKDTKDEAKPTLESTLATRHQARQKAPTMESRNITALETIADELTAIRVHLTGKV